MFQWLNEREHECEEIEIDMPDDCMQEMRADECRVCGLLTRENEMVKIINIEWLTEAFKSNSLCIEVCWDIEEQDNERVGEHKSHLVHTLLRRSCYG